MENYVWKQNGKEEKAEEEEATHEWQPRDYW